VTGPLDQVPAAIARVRREIVLARFLGKLAVDQGLREARDRVEALVGSLVPSPPGEPIDVEGTEVVPHRSAPDAPAAPDAPVVTIDPDTLALPGYDHLPASDIVAKLGGLDPDERDAIEAYERQGRGRRTVLGRLEQLKVQEAP
jgi:hypothetical protein